MPVTQADRDAAADVAKSYREQKNGNWQDRIRKGECDDGALVQAFAAHRETALDEAAAKFRDAIGRGYPEPENKRDKCPHDRFGWDDCIACYDEHLEAAILALKANPHD